MSRTIEADVLDKRLELDGISLRKCIAILDSNSDFPVPEGSLEIAFVSPRECSQLHKRFFNDPEITDVMTFPGDPEDQHAGDIAICPEMAFTACRERGLAYQEELSLYLVHAWLHLAGFDDQEDVSRKEMRQAESVLMTRLIEESALLSCSWNS